MPPPFTTPHRASIYPSNDSATYRDLLYFEERLKTNAARLQRRKARYQVFLLQLLFTIFLLLFEVSLPQDISIISIPFEWILQKLLPDIYSPDVKFLIHPYISSGLLFVSVTTLVLFFASGMYSEKIAYANKYVPQANRALRSFNMHLNMRRPPLRSKFYVNPLSFFFPRPEEHRSAKPSFRSPSPPRTPLFRPASTTLPIPPIPPASNPRGELIFSSRVDKSFQEAYERYRAQFERRREEKDREENKKWWRERIFFCKRTPVPAPGASPTLQVVPVTRRTISNSSTSSRGGKASRSGTPPMTSSLGGLSGTENVAAKRHRHTTPSPVRSAPALRDSPPPLERSKRDSRCEDDMRTYALEKSLGLGLQPITHPNRVCLEEFKGTAELAEE